MKCWRCGNELTTGDAPNSAQCRRCEETRISSRFAESRASIRSEPLLAVYERFKHLDSVLVMVGDSDGTENTDPFHAATRDLWQAVKESLGHTANVIAEG